MVKPVRIGERIVGPGFPCLVIAEAGVNHNGSLDRALRLVEIAAKAGADIVKFQTFKSEEVISPVAPKADYQIQTTGDSESQLEMVKKLELPPEAFQAIARHCRECGIVFLSTPFDNDSADLLQGLGVVAFKVSSGELTNLPFLTYLAQKEKPLILSTGMANLAEVTTAVECVRATGNNELVVLHCVSNYPAAPSSVNLRAMKTLEDVLGTPVGYSDHSEWLAIPVGAAALGACVIEKHFTLDRGLPGPDHRASLEPAELAAMVRGIRDVQAALGDGLKRPAPEELNTAAVARRSLVAACDLNAEMILTGAMVAIRRPGTGLPPSALSQVIGRRLKQDVVAGDLFTLEMLA
ncbi:MAG TPA: N-acetylneuraminate synthase [Edaphobacter sp.]|nr:N-acetylneuraminate synthase [Edaphobacter sp.]